MMSLLCRFIWVVQSLDKVVDMPVIVNDSDCKQWKCLKLHRRQRQWHVAPGFAGFAFRVAFLTIAGRCIFSAWSLTRPLRTTTWVVVQTVQFLDKFVALPVVFTTVALGSRRSENVWRCRRCSSAWLWTSLCHATPMWC